MDAATQHQITTIEAGTQHKIATTNAGTQHDEDDVTGTGPLGFRFIKELGAGQYGAVYEVERENTKFALKKMLRGVETAEVEPWCVALSHTNIVQCHGYLLDADYQYVIQDLYPGDLYGHISQQGRLPEEEAKRLLSAIMDGVKHLQDRDIVHRDLKPENILMRAGVPIITDFGWAVHLNGGKIRGRVGSIAYMAPEVLENKLYDHTIDLWSCGVLYYTMLNGYLPFDTIEQSIAGDYDTFDVIVTFSGLEIFKNLIEISPESRRYLGN